jgi:putative DNA primase/helicase
MPTLHKDDLTTIYSFVKSANKRAGVMNLISLGKSDERIAVHHDNLNRGRHLLNVHNGCLNLITRNLEKHLPERLITQLAPVTFDPSANCPRWEDAISLIFGGDVELIRFVRQLLGYALHGDRGEHLLPVCYGSGANGKSFLWNTIVRLLGNYAGLANDSLLLGTRDSGHPTEKCFLYEKRFVPISEPEQNSKLREAKVKELTGDSTITARRMREDFWSFERTHLLWLSTNHLPKVSGSDEGIWRRIKLIPFCEDLRKVTKPIPDYDKLLADEEGSGILNWCLDGLADYLTNGLQEPSRVANAVDEYRNSEDELTLFIEENCEVGVSCKVDSADLFDAYQSWGGRLSRTAFGRSMGERFPRRRAVNIKRRKVTVYDGIELASDSETIGSL